MPDDDMVLVRRDDLRAVLEEEYVRVDRIERLAAAVNGEAATEEYRASNEAGDTYAPYPTIVADPPWHVKGRPGALCRQPESCLHGPKDS